MIRSVAVEALLRPDVQEMHSIDIADNYAMLRDRGGTGNHLALQTHVPP